MPHPGKRSHCGRRLRSRSTRRLSFSLTAARISQTSRPCRKNLEPIPKASSPFSTSSMRTGRSVPTGACRRNCSAAWTATSPHTATSSNRIARSPRNRAARRWPSTALAGPARKRNKLRPRKAWSRVAAPRVREACRPCVSGATLAGPARARVWRRPATADKGIPVTRSIAVQARLLRFGTGFGRSALRSSLLLPSCSTTDQR